MLRTRRIGLQLLPQVPHINAQIVAVLHRIRPPDLIEQLPLGQHLAGIIEQYRQQALKKALLEFEPGAQPLIEAVMFLLDSQYSTGSNVVINGGRHLKNRIAAG